MIEMWLILSQLVLTIFNHNMMARQLPPLPLPVRRACRKLGGDIRDARRRRRLTVAIVADRARIPIQRRYGGSNAVCPVCHSAFTPR